MSDEMGTQGMTPEQPAVPPVAPEEAPAPAPAAPTPMPPAMPVVSAKPKTDVLFFIIGFIIAMLALPLGSAALGAVLSTAPINGIVGTAILTGLVIVVIAIFVSLMVAGRRRDNIRLRSFGLGGLWASIVIPLVLLLTIGSCLVLTGQTGA
jgi:hypothetical protein